MFGRRIVAPAFVLLTAAWLAAGCARGPQPIAYGSDACGHCRMVISDRRYGAELVTPKGKVHKFDSVECLAAYYLGRREAGDVESVWVTDVEHPGTLVPAEAARYVRVDGPASPMGKGLVALGPNADVEAVRRSLGGGEPMQWAGVLALVEREGIGSGSVRASDSAHAH